MELLGRERELEAIDRLFESARGQGGALLVRGEPGVGKSALLAVAADRARAAGMHILGTTGIEAESHLPFAALHQIVHPILARITDLPGPQARAFSAAFGMTDDVAPDAFFIALATMNLLADWAADSPLLITVDDAHWVDASSADVLAFLVRVDGDADRRRSGAAGW